MGSPLDLLLIKLLMFLHALAYFFNKSLSPTLKNIVLALSKLLTYPIILGSNMHKGLITLLSLYTMKYLIGFFEPYCSFSEINILLASMSSTLNSF